MWRSIIKALEWTGHGSIILSIKYCSKQNETYCELNIPYSHQSNSTKQVMGISTRDCLYIAHQSLFMIGDHKRSSKIWSYKVSWDDLDHLNSHWNQSFWVCDTSFSSRFLSVSVMTRNGSDLIMLLLPKKSSLNPVSSQCARDNSYDRALRSRPFNRRVSIEMRRLVYKTFR